MTQNSDFVRGYPWPVLEEGNRSFPDGEYAPEISMGADGASVTITHIMRGAPLIKRLLAEGTVCFGCTISVPITGFRKFITAPAKQEVQRIEWDQNQVGEPPFIHPLAVCAQEHEFTITGDDGVSPMWVGKRVKLAKGSKIVLGPFFRTASTLKHLITIEQKPELESGQLEIEASSSDGFYFKARVAEDLFKFLRQPGGVEAQKHRKSIMTHIVSCCFEQLHTNYKVDEDWDSYSNLKELAADMEDKGLGHWGNEDFKPEVAATALEPHRVPLAEDEEENEG